MSEMAGPSVTDAAGVQELAQAFVGWTDRERQEFRRVANKLLARTFLVRRKEADQRDYFFVKRRERAFRAFFATAGWELRADPVYDVYQLVNPEGSNRQRFTLEESLIFLIVRLLFEQKRQELTMAEAVVIRIQEIQDQYAALRIRERPLEKGSLTSTLRRLRDFSLLEPLETDLSDPETRLILYPSLLLAVHTDDLQRTEQMIERYRREVGLAAEEGADEEGAEMEGLEEDGDEVAGVEAEAGATPGGDGPPEVLGEGDDA